MSSPYLLREAALGLAGTTTTFIGRQIESWAGEDQLLGNQSQAHPSA
jgi:hypothetical protein